MEINKLKNILEAVLLAADRALTVIHLESLFELDEERPTRDEIRKALHEMAEDYEGRGYELKQVASGFRLQVRQEFAHWVGRLWEERPAKYTRALLETMSLIAYRQPITRGEIEEVRGVSVSSNIIKTLMERDWIKVLGHKDVPGKPTLYGSTKEFLDYFNLKSLDQLPTLAEIKDLDSIHPELELDDDAVKGEADPAAPEDQADDSAESGIAAANDDSVQDADETPDADKTGDDTVVAETEGDDAVMETSEDNDAPVIDTVAEDLDAEDTDAEEAVEDEDVKSAFNV
ncbi:MAG: SMC-Scp complex subunit ScpB [Proteobacteria bacterium]|nr:SMC-Scp complex subunit ScpB [Pseudomonadota bacterium]